MRAVIQRVKQAKVDVDETTVGQIQDGLLVLLGFKETDDNKTAEYMLDKLLGLRIFEDDKGKMNDSLLDIGGGLLIVPNFTLYGDCRKGKRPSYSSGAGVEKARDLFINFISMAKEKYEQVEKGVFQADMKVSLINDGPVTLLLDSEKNF